MAIRDALVVTTIATGEQWFVHRPSVKGACFREVVGPASVHAIAMASDRISDLSAAANV